MAGADQIDDLAAGPGPIVLVAPIEEHRAREPRVQADERQEEDDPLRQAVRAGVEHQQHRIEPRPVVRQDQRALVRGEVDRAVDAIVDPQQAVDDQLHEPHRRDHRQALPATAAQHRQRQDRGGAQHRAHRDRDPEDREAVRRREEPTDHVPHSEDISAGLPGGSGFG
ncbi:MAG: hypothetical protein ABMB14_20865 [Myxococcota bacterium]